MVVEELDRPQEIDHGPADAIVPVDRHHVDLFALNVLEHALERGTVGVLAREASVHVILRQRFPALDTLAVDVAADRLGLGFEGIELEIVGD